MEEEKTFYLLDLFNTIPVSDPEVWLGRITRNFAKPFQGYIPETPGLDLSKILDDDNYSDLRTVVKNASKTSTRAVLEGLFKISASEQSNHNPSIEAAKVRRLRITQDDEAQLAKVLEDKTAKEKTLEWLGYFSSAYFVVGCLCTDSVVFSDDRSHSKSTEGELNLPTKKAAAAAGAPNLPAGDIALERSQEDSSEARSKATVTGSRIFALEYRVIKRRLLSFQGKVDMQSHGLDAARMFAPDSKDEAQEGKNDSEQQIAEIFLDEDPLEELEDIEGHLLAM